MLTTNLPNALQCLHVIENALLWISNSDGKGSVFPPVPAD